MLLFAFLIECSIFVVTFCAPQFRFFDDHEEETETSDYDLFIHLEQIGDKVYGHPKPSTGKIFNIPIVIASRSEKASNTNTRCNVYRRNSFEMDSG